MHKLLIENRLDGFTVIEARDMWLSIDGATSDPVEARKKVYRQILRFEKNKWLRNEGSGRTKLYFQTEQLKNMFSFASSRDQVELEPQGTVQNYSVLINERNEYKGELEIVLGEVDEYQSIVVRFPELENQLAPLHQQAKERAALLLGKVNVLTKVLNTLSVGNEPC
ncbi:transcriptional regulator VspR [Vibrio inusitatus NBRC 102082]|uniref:Transcriptional regulator VspR n=2 Tax=Vibrio inusitatus TaxID=413402 RepID=A0A4Y3HWR1_9VIBR|nr:transcriptional regulator VspR [Vibrio inusitatus NBRC 102082]